MRILKEGIQRKQFQAVDSRQRLRRSSAESGFALVEMLVATLVLSFVMMGLMQGLAQVHHQTTGSQNQNLASNICQTLIDNARNESWASLQANADGAWHNVIVNRSSAGQVATGQPAYLTRQVGIDLSNSGYSYTAQSQNNLFRGTVQQRIEDIGSNQVRFSVQVSWPNETGPGNRSLQMFTVISLYGIHN